jgi:hypothetical protein
MSKNKSNEPYLKLVSGACTGKLLEALEEQFENPVSVLYAYDALEKLYDCGNHAEAYGLVHVLYDMTGLQFAAEAENLCQTDDGRKEYLCIVVNDLFSMIN